MTPEEVSDRLVTFAVSVGTFCEQLPDTLLGRHIGGQLVRACTAPATVYEEACAAESRADFVEKLSVVLKELRETRLWLRIIQEAKLLGSPETQSAVSESAELCEVIGRTLITARRNTDKWRKHAS